MHAAYSTHTQSSYSAGLLNYIAYMKSHSLPVKLLSAMSSLGFAWVRRPGVSLLQPLTCHQARPSARVPCFYSDIESCDIADQECFSLSLRLQDAKVRLQAAVGKEDYLLAVDLRDLIARLELDHRRLSVAQARRDVMYDVGVVVKHRYRGYQGVVVGKDPTCLAPENWQKEQRVNLLPRGKNQPFYHVCC